MTFWRKVLLWLVVLFVGRGLNLWQIHAYGFMPIYAFWGDWIPIANTWLFSIGDVLQLTGVAAIVLTTLIRFADERYVRMGAK